MNIFFTGHKGFLGRELIPELEKLVKIHKFTGDLLDIKKVESFIKVNSIDRILHAAARGGRRIKEDSPRILAENFAVSMNIRSFELPTIYFCSGAIYGRQTSINGYSENRASERYPEDYYGQSKYLTREILISDPRATFLRFFNVFGESEGLDRFISYNLNRYINKAPMKVFKNFYMDFFFSRNTLPVLQKWIKNENLPKEINMVYGKKYTLLDICNMINTLDSHVVPIEIDSREKGNDYYGDGSQLEKLQLPLLDLNSSLKVMYRSMFSS